MPDTGEPKDSTYKTLLILSLLVTLFGAAFNFVKDAQADSAHTQIDLAVLQSQYRSLDKKVDDLTGLVKKVLNGK